MVQVGSSPPRTIRLMMEKVAFDHVVREVLGIPDDDLLLKALDGNGIVSLPDLLTLTDQQIDTLYYDDGAGARLPSLASRNKLRILRSWNFHLQMVQGCRTVDWMDSLSVNETEWVDYRVAVYVPIQVARTTTSRSTPSAKRVTHGRVTLSRSIQVSPNLSSSSDGTDSCESDAVSDQANPTILDEGGRGLDVSEHGLELAIDRELDVKKTKDHEFNRNDSFFGSTASDEVPDDGTAPDYPRNSAEDHNHDTPVVKDGDSKTVVCCREDIIGVTWPNTWLATTLVDEWDGLVGCHDFHGTPRHTNKMSIATMFVVNASGVLVDCYGDGFNEVDFVFDPGISSDQARLLLVGDAGATLSPLKSQTKKLLKGQSHCLNLFFYLVQFLLLVHLMGNLTVNEIAPPSHSIKVPLSFLDSTKVKAGDGCSQSNLFGQTALLCIDGSDKGLHDGEWCEPEELDCDTELEDDNSVCLDAINFGTPMNKMLKGRCSVLTPCGNIPKGGGGFCTGDCCQDDAAEPMKLFLPLHCTEKINSVECDLECTCSILVVDWRVVFRDHHGASNFVFDPGGGGNRDDSLSRSSTISPRSPAQQAIF